MSDGAFALIAGHGEFARGMASAVEAILGSADAFVTMSNDGLSGEDMQELLRQTVDRMGIRVICTDLPAGSLTMAARRVLRDHPGVVLVTGTNLAVLLAIASAGEGGREQIGAVVERARQSLQHAAG